MEEAVVEVEVEVAEVGVDRKLSKLHKMTMFSIFLFVYRKHMFSFFC